ncbi:MAG: aldo/keto reductase [Eubacteriales bacterium]
MPRIFPGVKVSALGYGCMRFPTNPDETINEPEAISLIRHAIDSGVNYIDTAFGYHHGKSEGLLKMALADGYREKVFLADKMPVWLVKEEADFEKLFNIQLERLGTDHIDFYLLHSLNAGSFRDTVLRFDLFEKMRALKRAGKVSYIGFSFHDSNEVFHEIVDSFEGADFCQIQYNWANTDYQAGTEGLSTRIRRGWELSSWSRRWRRSVNLPDNVRAAFR